MPVPQARRPAPRLPKRDSGANTGTDFPNTSRDAAGLEGVAIRGAQCRGRSRDRHRQAGCRQRPRALRITLASPGPVSPRSTPLAMRHDLAVDLRTRASWRARVSSRAKTAVPSPGAVPSRSRSNGRIAPFGVVVALRELGEEVEPAEAQRVNLGLAAADEHHVGRAAAKDAERLAERDRPGGVAGDLRVARPLDVVDDRGVAGRHVRQVLEHPQRRASRLSPSRAPGRPCPGRVPSDSSEFTLAGPRSSSSVAPMTEANSMPMRSGGIASLARARRPASRVGSR